MNNTENETNKKNKKSKFENYKSIEYDAIEEDDGEFITIGDNINKIHIDKSKIKRGYIQAPKTTRSWKTLWLKKLESPDSVKIQAIDIFNDKDYTYFKFDREDAMSKFPVVFKVVDGYDNPVNVKIVGNYIIAEDLSEKWTLKMGDEYVCVRMLQKPQVVREKVIINEETKEYDGKTTTYQKNQEKIKNQDTIDSRDTQELIKRNQERIKELEKLKNKAKSKAKL